MAAKPVAGAVVYLQNGGTQEIRSYLTDASGHFHFNHLLQNTDYTVWAEAHGQRSKTRSISSFNSKSSLAFNLKLKK